MDLSSPVILIFLSLTLPESDVIINGLRGLSVLSPNPSNPPFQVRWDKNRIYNKNASLKKGSPLCFVPVLSAFPYTLQSMGLLFKWFESVCE